MSLRRRLAFTIVEVLIVVAIVAIVASILLPVVVRAKVASKQSVCAANLHQSSVALDLYLEDSGGEYPSTRLLGKLVRSTSPITASYAATGVFRCPLDRPQGRSGLPLDDRREPQSFMRTWLLWEGESGKLAWDGLLASDPDPILFRCYFHDANMRRLLLSSQELSSFGAFHNGLALVARKDGSVGFDRRNDSWVVSHGPAFPAKEEIWAPASRTPCPPRFCDGKPPEEGWRGQ